MAFDYFDPNQNQQGNQNVPNQNNQQQGAGAADTGDASNPNTSPTNGTQNSSSTQQTLGSTSPITTGDATGQQGGGTASGNQFSNLQSYLDANKDQNFGGKVADKVQGQIDDASQTENESGNRFKGMVDQNTVSADQDMLNWAKYDPTKVANDDNSYQSFSKMRDARYNGPKDFSDNNEDYSKTWNAVQSASNTAKQVQDESGRDAYLQQAYGSGAGRYDYTQGMQNLDNLLIQADPDSQRRFSQIGENGQKLQNSWGQLNQDLGNYANAGANTTAATRAAARGAVGIDDNGNLLEDSQINQISKAAQAQADKYNQDKNQHFQQFNNDLTGRNLNAQELAQTGLQQGQHLWSEGNGPLNLSQFASSQPDANLNTAATKEQQQNVAAYAKLAALQNSYLPYADQAGTYDPSKDVQFDANRLQGTLASNEAAYNDRLNAHYDNQIGQFDWNSGQGTPGASQNVTQALAYNAPGAAAAADYHFNDTSPIFRYQAALQALQRIQKGGGFEDLVNPQQGAGPQAGDWSTYRNYNGFTDPKFGPVPTVDTSLLNRPSSPFVKM